MAKEFKTTIKIGGDVSPTLAAAAASASKTLNKLADETEKRDMLERHRRETHAKAEELLAKKVAKSKGAAAERHALKLRQLQEDNARDERALARKNAEYLSNLREKAAREQKKGFDKRLLDQQIKMQKYNDRMQKFGSQLLKTVSLPMISLAAMGLKTYMEFDDSMRQVQATLQASDEDMVKLTAAARQMGRDTRFSASEAAQAILAIGQAGNDTAQTLAMLPVVLNTAQASGLGIDSVAEYMSQTISILGVGQDYIDDWADQVNKTAAAATVSQQQIFDSVIGAGDVSKMMKGGTVELLTMIGLLGQAGVQGAEAGTAIRGMMNKLATASDRDEAAKVLEDLNVQLTDSEGNFLEMNDIFGQFQQALKGMGNQEQVNLMSKIFGEEYGSKALGLISKAGVNWETMSQQINASQGVTEQMAQTMEGGLGGSMRSLKSAGEDVLITIGEKLAPQMQHWAGVLTDCANWVSSLDEGTWSLLGNLGMMATSLGVGSKLIGGLIKLSTAIMGIRGKNARDGMLGATTMAGKFWSALKVPLGAATPYVALAAGIAGISMAIDKAHQAALKADLNSRFGALSLSDEEISTVTSSISTAFVAAANELNTQWAALETTVAALAAKDMDLSIKLSATVTAPKLSQDDIAALQKEYAEYTESVYSALGAKSGVVQMTLQQTFGTDSETGKDWSGFASAYYSGLQAEAQKYGALIDSEFQKALAGGEIDYEAVASYQQKVSNIYREIQQQQRSAEMYTFAEKIKSGALSYESTTELHSALKQQLDADKASINDLYMRAIGEVRAIGESQGKTPAEIEAAVAELYGKRDAEYARSTAQYAKVVAETIGASVGNAVPEIAQLDAAAGEFDYRGWMAQYQELQARIEENPSWANENKAEYNQQLVALGQGLNQMQALYDKFNLKNSDVALTLFEDLGGQEQLDEYTSSIAALQAAGEQVSPELQAMKDQLEALKLMGNPLAVNEAMANIGKNLNLLSPEQLTAAQAELEQAGANGAAGMAEGLTAGAAGVATAGGDMAQAGVDAATAALKVNSPSLVMHEIGAFAGQGLAQGITASQGAVASAMGGLLARVRGQFAPSWASAWSAVASSMGAAMTSMVGYMDSAMSRVVSSAQSGLNKLREMAASAGTLGGGGVPQMAKGATITSPMIVEVAEAGYPETIVPHTDTPRSRALLADAAAGVGVGLGGINITFAPSIVVQGGGDAVTQIEQAMDDIEGQFEMWFERFMARQRAIGYGAV